MSNSAARIAEIRQALSSTGKSVSDYSARFAAGQAPEQVKVEGVIAAAAAAREASVGAVLNQDEVFNLLAELTSTCKVQRARAAGRRSRERPRPGLPAWCSAAPSQNAGPARPIGGPQPGRGERAGAGGACPREGSRKKT